VRAASGAGVREASESVVEVGEVAILQRRRVLELVENRQDVVERSDGGQRQSFGRSLKAA
jgi:hypothetical protein